MFSPLALRWGNVHRQCRACRLRGAATGVGQRRALQWRPILGCRWHSSGAIDGVQSQRALLERGRFHARGILVASAPPPIVVARRRMCPMVWPLASRRQLVSTLCVGALSGILCWCAILQRPLISASAYRGCSGIQACIIRSLAVGCRDALALVGAVSCPRGCGCPSRMAWSSGRRADGVQLRFVWGGRGARGRLAGSGRRAQWASGG